MSRESNMAPARPERVNRVKVKISGEEYTIKTGASAAHVEKVAALVDKRLKEAAKALPTVPMHRLAIFVALNLADELVRREERDAGGGVAGGDRAGKSGSHIDGKNSPAGKPETQQAAQQTTPQPRAQGYRFKNLTEDRL
ncbi:MAG: cell division protein ZapA [Firmicutes bacterium]|nr:cell division protein ZapA [Bacillota bacterium]